MILERYPQTTHGVFAVYAKWDSSDESRGSCFPVYKDEQKIYFITCAHVVMDDDGNPAEIIKIAGCEASHETTDLSHPSIRDLAVLSIQNQKLAINIFQFKAPSARRGTYVAGGATVKLGGGRKVVTPTIRLVKESEWIGEDNSVRVRTWDAETTENVIEGSFSGGPVFLCDDDEDGVVGVVSSWIERGPTGTVVDIRTLLQVWPGMPASLQQTLLALEVPVNPAPPVTLTRAEIPKLLDYCDRSKEMAHLECQVGLFLSERKTSQNAGQAPAKGIHIRRLLSLLPFGRRRDQQQGAYFLVISGPASECPLEFARRAAESRFDETAGRLRWRKGIPEFRETFETPFIPLKGSQGGSSPAAQRTMRHEISSKLWPTSSIKGPDSGNLGCLVFRTEFLFTEWMADPSGYLEYYGGFIQACDDLAADFLKIPVVVVIGVERPDQNSPYYRENQSESFLGVARDPFRLRRRRFSELTLGPVEMGKFRNWLEALNLQKDDWDETVKSAIELFFRSDNELDMNTIRDHLDVWLKLQLPEAAVYRGG
jgi:hypothetical protein